MKVDEPLTPYNNNHNNNNNMNDEEICSDEESNDGVDAFKLEEEYYIFEFYSFHFSN